MQFSSFTKKPSISPTGPERSSPLHSSSSSAFSLCRSFPLSSLLTSSRASFSSSTASHLKSHTSDPNELSSSLLSNEGEEDHMKIIQRSSPLPPLLPPPPTASSSSSQSSSSSRPRGSSKDSPSIGQDDTTPDERRKEERKEDGGEEEEDTHTQSRGSLLTSSRSLSGFFSSVGWGIAARPWRGRGSTTNHGSSPTSFSPPSQEDPRHSSSSFFASSSSSLSSSICMDERTSCANSSRRQEEREKDPLRSKQPIMPSSYPSSSRLDLSDLGASNGEKEKEERTFNQRRESRSSHEAASIEIDASSNEKVNRGRCRDLTDTSSSREKGLSSGKEDLRTLLLDSGEKERQLIKIPSFKSFSGTLTSPRRTLRDRDEFYSPRGDPPQSSSSFSFASSSSSSSSSSSVSSLSYRGIVARVPLTGEEDLQGETVDLHVKKRRKFTHERSDGRVSEIREALIRREKGDRDSSFPSVKHASMGEEIGRNECRSRTRRDEKEERQKVADSLCMDSYQTENGSALSPKESSTRLSSSSSSFSLTSSPPLLSERGVEESISSIREKEILLEKQEKRRLLWLQHSRQRQYDSGEEERPPSQSSRTMTPLHEVYIHPKIQEGGERLDKKTHRGVSQARMRCNTPPQSLSPHDPENRLPFIHHEEQQDRRTHTSTHSSSSSLFQDHQSRKEEGENVIFSTSNRCPQEENLIQPWRKEIDTQEKDKTATPGGRESREQGGDTNELGETKEEEEKKNTISSSSSCSLDEEEKDDLARKLATQTYEPSYFTQRDRILFSSQQAAKTSRPPTVERDEEREKLKKTSSLNQACRSPRGLRKTLTNDRQEKANLLSNTQQSTCSSLPHTSHPPHPSTPRTATSPPRANELDQPSLQPKCHPFPSSSSSSSLSSSSSASLSSSSNSSPPPPSSSSSFFTSSSSSSSLAPETGIVLSSPKESPRYESSSQANLPARCKASVKASPSKRAPRTDTKRKIETSQERDRQSQLSSIGAAPSRKASSAASSLELPVKKTEIASSLSSCSSSSSSFRRTRSPLTPLCAKAPSAKSSLSSSRISKRREEGQLQQKPSSLSSSSSSCTSRKAVRSRSSSIEKHLSKQPPRHTSVSQERHTKPLASSTFRKMSKQSLSQASSLKIDTRKERSLPSSSFRKVNRDPSHSLSLLPSSTTSSSTKVSSLSPSPPLSSLEELRERGGGEEERETAREDEVKEEEERLQSEKDHLLPNEGITTPGFPEPAKSVSSDLSYTPSDCPVACLSSSSSSLVLDVLQEKSDRWNDEKHRGTSYQTSSSTLLRNCQGDSHRTPFPSYPCISRGRSRNSRLSQENEETCHQPFSFFDPSSSRSLSRQLNEISGDTRDDLNHALGGIEVKGGTEYKPSDGEESYYSSSQQKKKDVRNRDKRREKGEREEERFYSPRSEKKKTEREKDQRRQEVSGRERWMQSKSSSKEREEEEEDERSEQEKEKEGRRRRRKDEEEGVEGARKEDISFEKKEKDEAHMNGCSYEDDSYQMSRRRRIPRRIELLRKEIERSRLSPFNRLQEEDHCSFSKKDDFAKEKAPGEEEEESYQKNLFHHQTNPLVVFRRSLLEDERRRGTSPSSHFSSSSSSLFLGTTEPAGSNTCEELHPYPSSRETSILSSSLRTKLGEEDEKCSFSLQPEVYRKERFRLPSSPSLEASSLRKKEIRDDEGTDPETTTSRRDGTSFNQSRSFLAEQKRDEGEEKEDRNRLLRERGEESKAFSDENREEDELLKKERSCSSSKRPFHGNSVKNRRMTSQQGNTSEKKKVVNQRTGEHQGLPSGGGGVCTPHERTEDGRTHKLTRPSPHPCIHPRNKSSLSPFPRSSSLLTRINKKDDHPTSHGGGKEKDPLICPKNTSAPRLASSRSRSSSLSSSFSSLSGRDQRRPTTTSIEMREGKKEEFSHSIEAEVSRVTVRSIQKKGASSSASSVFSKKNPETSEKRRELKAMRISSPMTFKKRNLQKSQATLEKEAVQKSSKSLCLLSKNPPSIPPLPSTVSTVECTYSKEEEGKKDDKSHEDSPGDTAKASCERREENPPRTSSSTHNLLAISSFLSSSSSRSSLPSSSSSSRSSLPSSSSPLSSLPSSSSSSSRSSLPSSSSSSRSSLPSSSSLSSLPSSSSSSRSSLPSSSSSSSRSSLPSSSSRSSLPSSSFSGLIKPIKKDNENKKRFTRLPPVASSSSSSSFSSSSSSSFPPLPPSRSQLVEKMKRRSKEKKKEEEGQEEEAKKSPFTHDPSSLMKKEGSSQGCRNLSYFEWLRQSRFDAKTSSTTPKTDIHTRQDKDAIFLEERRRPVGEEEEKKKKENTLQNSTAHVHTDARRRRKEEGDQEDKNKDDREKKILFSYQNEDDLNRDFSRIPQGGGSATRIEECEEGRRREREEEEGEGERTREQDSQNGHDRERERFLKKKDISFSQWKKQEEEERNALLDQEESKRLLLQGVKDTGNTKNCGRRRKEEEEREERRDRKSEEEWEKNVVYQRLSDRKSEGRARQIKVKDFVPDADLPLGIGRTGSVHRARCIGGPLYDRLLPLHPCRRDNRASQTTKFSPSSTLLSSSLQRREDSTDITQDDKDAANLRYREGQEKGEEEDADRHGDSPISPLLVAL
ncbi:hypothetical protein CSUI_010128, partial [Cystoisospora suis]